MSILSDAKETLPVATAVVPFHMVIGHDVPTPVTCMVNAIVFLKYTPKLDELFVIFTLASISPFMPFE
jgi:hypothetical protein